MNSIKKSFANCLECDLLDSPSCVLETNCEKDLSEVEVLFIAENPGKDEVRANPPRPLIGRSGQTFRRFFKIFKLDKLKYLITNVVLCQTINPDGTTGNPTDDVIEKCKVNCMNLIEICNPKLVVLLGTSPMKAFDIAKSGITKIHGNIFKWKNYNIFITVHPSFVNRNQKVWMSKFEEDMAKIAGIVKGKKIKVKKDSGVKKLGKTGIHRYKIPEKFYTDKYRLIDVQYLNTKKQVLYIFRDGNNKKVYHTENDDYICYQAPAGLETRKIVPYNELDQVCVAFKDQAVLDPDITYEGDVKITIKHAMDYYHFNQGEAKKTESNIKFFDIEIDTGKHRGFPHATDAAFPINMISSIYNKKQISYVVDNKTEPIVEKKGFESKIFKSEFAMMKEFIKDFKDEDPDYIAGWNSINFDLSYIFNRLPKLKINQRSMSLFNEFYVDGPKYFCKLAGCIAIDQEFMYRTFTFTKMENYKLGFIAQYELGKTKIQLPLPMNEMYWKMLNLTIDYNIRDTEIIKEMEDKLQHINLINELRIVCKTSFEGISSFSQIDSLMLNHLKSKDWASKNADMYIKKKKYPGAFVFDPIPGIYNNITDFDFASLYPNIMITYNIGINNFVMKFDDPTLGYDLTYHPENLPEKIKVIIDPTYAKKEVIIAPDQLLKKIKEQNLVYTINGCFFKAHDKEVSVFSDVVGGLMSTRKSYKDKMFDSIEEKDKTSEFFYYTRQLVYKVLANTLYGVVANKSFRFFDISLAAAVTLSGQEALKASIIEGDAYMRHLDTRKDYVKPLEISKKEMYEKEMPTRSHEYIVTGDTDSIFCCFQNFSGDKTVEKIQNWCEGVQSFLNNDIMTSIVERHNVPLDYNKLVLKNELIISRGLFLAKKRYAIRVINKEGKDVDKVEYMGVEIKRSDYPSKSKEFLSQLIDLILKSEKVSLTQLLKFVNREKSEFVALIKKGDKSIARPVSWGKKLKDYKLVPQGVKAMLAWNNIMYDIHNTGNKGYMYRVSGIDTMTAPPEIVKKYEKFVSEHGKLEVIAIPDEEARLPSYFFPDIKGNLKFCFEDRHELMLKPLMDSKQNMEVITI